MLYFLDTWGQAVNTTLNYCHLSYGAIVSFLPLDECIPTLTLELCFALNKQRD